MKKKVTNVAYVILHVRRKERFYSLWHCSWEQRCTQCRNLAPAWASTSKWQRRTTLSRWRMWRRRTSWKRRNRRSKSSRSRFSFASSRQTQWWRRERPWKSSPTKCRWRRWGPGRPFFWCTRWHKCSCCRWCKMSRVSSGGGSRRSPSTRRASWLPFRYLFNT